MPATWTSCTDGESLRNAASEPDAFAELYRRHEPIVVAFLARRSSSPELAADLTAETFATALLKARRFRDTGEPAIGWLLGIARHQQLEAWRRGHAGDRALKRLGAERPVPSDTTLQRIEALSAHTIADPRLVRALSVLPASQREAVEAYVLDERPYAELAGEMGVPEATIRQRVSRGLAQMRRTLEGIR